MNTIYNEFFAEFMGYKIKWIHDTSTNGKDSYPLYIKNGVTTDTVTYHFLFDSLMDVVKEIETMGYTVNMLPHETFITDNNKIYQSDYVTPFKSNGDRFSSLYEACGQFCKWYIEQQNK